ncbi:hypothetical protein Pint_21768 [Pistacia integerrima]|uniref:Uncharacterized protein n=1 Tax=Pistacia integerrima TaxID=434235 RepID=A0ACC0XCW5_9ROSI|nr:hypothetical protein Pint_21768 [Pistacia integerrima]
MSSLSRELVFLILQFLDEEKFKETVHKLEQESGFFFNMKHFEDQVQAGEWDEVERYLCGFTKVEDNRYSMKIFFEIRKQKYLEALDRQDRAKAVEILVKDLKVFASFNEELFKEITQLLTLDNFRQNEQLSKYGDTKSARNIMLVELKKLIEANPLFRDKLTFPAFKSSRLRTLINQSLNWQHQLCKNPRPNPDIKTLFTDHSCNPTANGARPPPTNSPLVGPIPKAGAFPPIGAHGPFQTVVSPSPGAIAGWMSNNSPSLPHPAVAAGPPGLVQSSSAAAFLKHPRTPTGMTGMDYQSADSEHLMKRIRTGQSDEPLIVNALGPVGNVSGAIAPTLERPDRVPPAVSINSLGPMDSSRLVDVKPRIADDADKVKSWKIPDVSDPSQMKALRLPDSIAPSKLYWPLLPALFTSCGNGSVVKGMPLGKATAYVAPQLWQPPSGTLMTNDINDGKPAEESAACIALSKNDSYVMSASGGKVSLFNMMTFKVMTMFMPPPPAATYLAFHPQDNNIIAIGMEDSTIQIYNVRVDEVKTKLKGHQNRITGLAFSQTLNALVSSGADAQLCMWSIDKWEKLKSRFIQAPAGRQSPLVGETKVQFHNDQTHLLVVHDSQISIYDSKLECSRSWSPKDTLPAPISSAIYSCDGLLVYAGFCDGAVGVFDADNLRLRCRIAASAYIPSFSVNSNTTTYPFVIAAHPSEPNQIALGMSDGAVHVVEPSDAELKWGGTPSQDNGSLPSNSSNPSLSGQPSEHPTR